MMTENARDTLRMGKIRLSKWPDVYSQVFFYVNVSSSFYLSSGHFFLIYVLGVGKAGCGIIDSN